MIATAVLLALLALFVAYSFVLAVICYHCVVMCYHYAVGFDMLSLWT